MISIIAVIVLLGILIFVHEFGHFITAKYMGVGVLKFSLGFGPRIVGRKIGETEYVISLIPLGGYVKLLGESEEDELQEAEKERTFVAQSVWKRMAIVIAGPLSNLVLAVFIFTVVYSWGVPVLTAKIGSVQQDSAASRAALQREDLILAIDGNEIRVWSDLAEKVSRSEGRLLEITIRRGEEVLTVQVRPSLYPSKSIFGEEINAYKIGISPFPETIIERYNPIEALGEAMKQTWMISKLTLVSVYKILQGAISPRTMGGPIMIAQLAGAQVKEGIIPFILFMALLSINLAVLNMLPVPILDGGHMLFYLIEVVRGKEVSIKWRERAQQVGFVFLILVMLFVLVMDIERLQMPSPEEMGKAKP